VRSKLAQESVEKQEIQVSAAVEPSKRGKVMPLQELVESLKSMGDDIGQISELSSEERILITQFFTSLFKLMAPLAPSIQVSQLALPDELGNVTQAHVDPTGHLILQHEDGHIELKDLSEEKNRELMTTIIGDILPKFKNLTSTQKRKLENRIKFTSTITKEIQRSSEALAAAMSAGTQ
jgi:hypothetical protein